MKRLTIGTLAALFMTAVTVMPPSVSAQRRPASSELRLTHIAMVNASGGWGTSDDAVLRTSDGGHTWRRVLSLPRPTGVAPIPGWFAFASIGSSDAWVTGISKGEHLSTYRTSNGGRSWVQSSQHLKVGYPSDISPTEVVLTNAVDGWLLMQGLPGAGQMLQEIFRTTNSGRTWSRVESGNQKSGALSDCNDSVSQLSFMNAAIGFATGVCGAASTSTTIERTANGGRSWSTIMIPTPGAAIKFFNPHNVYVVGKGVLLLPVSFSSPPSFVLYRSLDGGLAWMPTTPIHGGNKSIGPIPFVSVLSNRVVWVFTNRSLYRTTDGGGRWYVMRHNPHLGMGVQLQFTNKKDGFALPGGSNGVVGQSSGEGSRFLFRTTNSGRTWKRVSIVS